MQALQPVIIEQETGLIRLLQMIIFRSTRGRVSHRLAGCVRLQDAPTGDDVCLQMLQGPTYHMQKMGSACCLPAIFDPHDIAGFNPSQ